MITALTQAITAARYYFQVKAIAADYELTQRIEQDTREIEAAIAALRARGDDSASRSADVLRERLIRTQGVAAHLSAARPSTGSGPAGDDKGGNLPAAGG